ncbi:hypothetical protein FQR65_LT18334 [Abscondita terminalis]|nr:hypothetical protein FQR65_LT18334 [Abscondita terminalis]
MRVCSLHFNSVDFVLPGIPTKMPRLKRNAVPSQNLPQKTVLGSKHQVKNSRRKLNRSNESSSISATKAVNDRENYNISPLEKDISKEFNFMDLQKKRHVAVLGLLELVDQPQEEEEEGEEEQDSTDYIPLDAYQSDE